MSKILPIPELPEEIKKAVENKKIAIFIGSGASRIYGCDSWDELADRLIERCFSIKKDDGRRLITCKEKKSLKREKDRKKVITICENILCENGYKNNYYDCLKEGLLYGKTLPKNNIYEYLHKMGLGGGIYITTNIDNHFSDKFENRLIYKTSQFDKINESYLYHIHGSINDSKSIVFTESEYSKRYGSNDGDNKKYLEFLEKIFSEYTVLFVGYGLDEPEILEFIAPKTDPNKSNEKNHFLLKPLYEKEEDILMNEKLRFNSLGVEVIGFAKDQNGYKQLAEVIKDWFNEIEIASSVLHNNHEEIEEIVDSVLCVNKEKEKVEKLMHLISNDDTRKRYFFRYVAKSKTPSIWLQFLKDKNFLKPKNSPLPEKSENQEGYYIPHWYILDFLETVAEENEKIPKENITFLLDKIVMENYEYIKKQESEDRNFRTEWVLLKIIARLPTDSLRPTHIKCIKKFLDSYWSNTLIASELARNIFPKILKTSRKDVVFPLFQAILGYRKIEQDSLKEIVPILGEFWLFEFLDNNIKEIVSRYPYDFSRFLIDLIEEIFYEKSSMFSIFSISDLEFNKSDFPRKI